MHRIMTILACCLTALNTPSAWALGQLIGGDLSFKGMVMAYPCSIAPDSERVQVDLGKISTKSLYINGKTQPVPFTIKLQNCTPSVFASVTVTFSGTENSNLADRLVISATSPGNAGGVGIGLLEEDDTPVYLNTPTTPTSISDTVLRLNYQAFVEAEPTALANGTIATGPFTATANYTLNYQ